MPDLGALRHYLTDSTIDKSLLRDIERKECVQSNYAVIRVFSLVAAVFVTIMLVMTFFNPVVSKHRAVYAVFTVLSLVLWYGTGLAYRRNPQSIRVLMYAAMGMFALYGIALGTYTDPGMQSTTFLVLMIFVPTLLVDRPERLSAAVVIADLAFVLASLHSKEGAVLSADLTDCIVFGFLSIVSIYYIMSIKFRRFAAERNMHALIITDQLTGLKNRTCFEQETEEYLARCRESVTLIYADANGLHDVNNNLGHTIGDQMLRFIGRCFQESFGADNVYRIGGDEFVVFVLDRPQMETEEKVAAVRERLLDEGYSISCGLLTQPWSQLDKESLVKGADRRMYADKASFYAGKSLRNEKEK